MSVRRAFDPPAIAPPYGRYHHGVLVERPERILALSGQLGITGDGAIPDDAGEQATLVFANIDAALAEAGMAREHVVRLTAYLTEATYRLAYMAARDAWVADPAPASTLLIVKALALPAFKVEVEALAVA